MGNPGGENIFRAYQLVAECGREVNSLVDLLADNLREALASHDNELPCVPAGGVKSDYGTDDDEAVWKDWLCSLPLKRRGKGNKGVEKYIAFQVSMMGSGCKVPGYAEPLLHVYCWASQPKLGKNAMEFPLDADDDIHIVGGRLIVWGDEEPLEWGDQGWAYSLKLVNLNSPDDLHIHVVRPVMGLLKGKPIAQALPENLPGLVEYPGVELLVSRK